MTTAHPGGTSPDPDPHAAHTHGETGDFAPRPADYWETRYADAEGGRMWVPRVNTVVATVAADLEPGRSLDLGCGEGGDVIWLAQRGWHATGIDISPTAVRRAQQMATDAGTEITRIRLIADDLLDIVTHPERLAHGAHPASFDLITASFLHAPPGVELPRTEILRAASRLVAPGGRMLVVTHAAPPPWADESFTRGHRFTTPDEDAAELALDPAEWATEVCEVRGRESTAPDGTPASLDDGVLLVRRRA